MADQKVNIKVTAQGAKKAEKDLDDVSKSINKMGKAVALASTAYFGARGFIESLSSVITLAGEQEQAEKKLSFALGRTSQALLAQATALQKTTRFGDEAIISQQAFLASIGFTEEKIKEIIPVALDLSEATGISLESAVRNTAKTFSGMAGELGELVPQIRDLTAEEMKAGDAVKVMGELFKGQAKSGADTLVGSIDQMRNAVSDVGETFGEVLAPAVRVASKLVVAFAGSIDAEKVKAYGVAVGGMGAIYLGATKGVILMNKAMLAFNKVSKKNIAVLAGTLAVGVLIDKLNLFADGTAEVGEEIKKLEKEINSLTNTTSKSLDQTHKLAMAELIHAQALQSTSEIEKQRQINTLELNQLREKHGVTEANFGRILTENTEFATEYNENRTKSIELEKAHAQATLQASSQMLSSFGALADQSGASARLAKTLAIAGATIDMYAGANKAFKQGGIFGFATGASIIAQGLVNISQMKAQRFAQGGIVQGDPSRGDVVPVMATAGELILNQAQQENLVANSGVTINISAPLVDETVVDSIIPAIEKAKRMNLA